MSLSSSNVSSTSHLLFYNGKICSFASSDPFMEAISISSGVIESIGSSKDLLAKYSSNPNYRQIDLHGRTVIPGLIDNHLHFIREGLNFNLELRWDGVKSLKTALKMLRDQADRTPDGQWIRVVGGWYEHQFEEKRLPTLQEINEIVPDKPVFLLHLYDCALINRVGLKLLYSDEKKTIHDPEAAEIQRDEKGNPTGLFIAKPNAGLLYSTLNQLPKLTLEEKVNSTLAYQRELNRLGLTSCLDPGGGFQSFPDDYEVIRKLDQDNQLTIRISYSLFPQRPKKELEDFTKWIEMVKPGHGSEFLKHLGAGEMLAFSAADFEDFKVERPNLPPHMEADLEPIVRLLAKHQWPMRLHATYGESIERALNVFERVAKDDFEAFAKLRLIIDHAETITAEDIGRIKKLGGGVAIQHRMAFQGEYFRERYGEAAASVAPPIGLIRGHHLPLGAGTDGTRVASYNPWISLYWLVTGKTVGGSQVYQASNCVDRVEALRLWTTANAWFEFQEHQKGSLQPGMLADLAVLSKDFFQVDEEEIKTIQSLCTLVGGKIAYIDPSFSEEVNLNVETNPLKVTPEWSPVNFYGGYQNESTSSHLFEKEAGEGTKDHFKSNTTREKTSETIDPHQSFEGRHEC